MNTERAMKELIEDEGLRLHPYQCTAGKTTIGVGRNLDDVGLTKEECLYLLANDIDKNWWDLKSVFGNLSSLPEEAQLVFMNLRHQLGVAGFRGFKKMIRAAMGRDWKTAAAELRDSKLWREDSPDRAERLAKRLESI